MFWPNMAIIRCLIFSSVSYIRLFLWKKKKKNEQATGNRMLKYYIMLLQPI